jgi:hypothetical protein
MSLRSFFVLLSLIAFARSAVAADDRVADDRAAREVALAQMLSGATLEGSFTITGRDLGKTLPEKYTLGEVKKIDGDNWLFPTRIEYGGRDLTVPLTLPIQWAGDTPVVVVDNVGIPGLGAVSARVLFFDDHYAGYWQHGEASGNLFGTIHRPPDAATDAK